MSKRNHKTSKKSKLSNRNRARRASKPVIFEAVENRLLLAVTPTIDLVDTFDTGASHVDNVTNLHNLQFFVTGNTGDNVGIYDGNNLLTTVPAPGPTGTTFSLTLADGTHTLRAVGGFILQNPSENLLVTVDSVVPTVSVPTLAATSGTAGLTKLAQPTLVGTAEANALVRLFADGVLVGQTVATTGGAWEITSEPLTDGTHTMTAQSEDLAGNLSVASAGFTATVDTTAPARPTLDLQTSDDSGRSDVDNITAKANPVRFVVTADANTTVVIRDGNVVIDTFAAAPSGTQTRSLTLADGTHLLSVASTDAAGNISAQSEELVVTIDRTDPSTSAPTLASSSDTGPSGDHITRIDQPVFYGTAEANSIVRLYANGILVGQATASPAGAWEITSEPLKSGVYSIRTQVEDLAGNLSPMSSLMLVTVDTLPPERPTIDLNTASDTGRFDLDNVTKLTTVTVTVKADLLTAVVIKDGTTVIDGPFLGGTQTRTLSLAEGSHLLSVESTDVAGNVSAQAEELVVTVDATAPDASNPTLAMISDSAALDNITKINQPAFVGTAEANALIRLYADGVLVGEATASPTGAWEITSEPLVDGDHVITTTVEDLAGNVSDVSGPLSITVDTLSPQRPTIDLNDVDDTGRSDLDNVTIGDQTASSNGIVDIRITADPGTTIFVKDGNTIVAGLDTPIVMDDTGEMTLTLDFNTLVGVTGFAAEGPHPLTVESVDVAGNMAQSEQLLVTIDFTAPAEATGVDLAPTADSGLNVTDHLTNINQPTITGFAEANAQVRVFVQRIDIPDQPWVLVGQTFVNSDESDFVPTDGQGTWEATLEPLVDGDYLVTTEVEDQAGNISPTSEAFPMTVDTSAPQRPTIDLTADSDTGRSNLDNVTIGDPILGDGVVRVRITADPGTTILVKDGNTIVAGLDTPITMDASGEIFLTLDFNDLTSVTGFPAQGPHPLTVESFDAAGNMTQSEEEMVTIDFTPPLALTIGLLEDADTWPLGDNITRINQPAFEGTAEPNTLVRLYANGELVGQSVVTSSGNWEITSEPLKDDRYVFATEVEDQAGNISELGQQNLIIAENYGYYLDPITNAVTFFGEDGVTDIVTLHVSGSDLVVDWLQPSAPSFSGSATFDLASTPSFTFQGFGGDDELIVDNSGGVVDLAEGITYDGGTGQDVLLLKGDVAMDTIYNPGPYNGNGVIDQTTSDTEVTGNQHIRFTNLEPVIDIVPGTLVVNGTNASNLINYAVGPNSGSAVVSGLDTRSVTVDNLESIEFGDQTALTINGLAGNDFIDLNGLDNPSGLTITVDGGDGNDTIIGSAGDDTFIMSRGQDTIEGRGGNDTLVFSGTGAGDEVTVTEESVSVNANKTTYTGIESLIGDTGAGDDSVTVSVGPGFPVALTLSTGVGSDDVSLFISNPGPTTTILVDGGPQGDTTGTDTVLVQGAPGDDQFTSIQEVGGVTEIIFNNGVLPLAGHGTTVDLINVANDPTVLEGFSIDGTSKTIERRAHTFMDADGDMATASMVGPGQANVFRNIFSPTGPDRHADVYTIDLVGTSEQKSTLSMRIRGLAGGDHKTSIGSINGSGLRGVIAAKSDLVGAGISLSGALRKLVLANIEDGADILLGGDSAQKLNLTAKVVGDVDLTMGGLLYNLQVTSWDDGVIEAAAMNKVSTTNGSFGPDLVIARQNRRGLGLIRSITVRHGDLLSRSITADRINIIHVHDGNIGDGTTPLQVTLLSDAATVRAERVRNVIDKMYVVGGDVKGLDVSMGEGTVFGSLSVQPVRGVGGNVVGAVNIPGRLNSANVGGNVNTDGWSVTGGVGTFNVRGQVTSMGGVATLDLGTGISKLIVGSLENVNVNADSIVTAQIKGYKGAALATRFMEQSQIITSSIASLRLLNTDLANSKLFIGSTSNIGKIVAKDRSDSSFNWVFPPAPGQLSNPFGFIV